jgi:NAD(P)-dependent dehydrogenase (short-subunit alcohol dehydrogenase family)
VTGLPVAVVTGANAGIGRATAAAIAALGYRTVLACRNPDRAAIAVAEIRASSGNDDVESISIDLSDLRAVVDCAHALRDRHGEIDVLVNNAGGFFSHRMVTPQGFEWSFGVNYLGHHVLTLHLLDAIAAGTPGRVVNVSSIAHRFVRDMRWDDLQLERGFWVAPAYGQSKLAQILSTRELARRLAGTGVTVSALHPGSNVRGDLARDGDSVGFIGAFVRFGNHFGMPATYAARTSVWLATTPTTLPSGRYWVRRREHRPSAAARSDDGAARLWRTSRELLDACGIEVPEVP